MSPNPFAALAEPADPAECSGAVRLLWDCAGLSALAEAAYDPARPVAGCARCGVGPDEHRALEAASVAGHWWVPPSEMLMFSRIKAGLAFRLAPEVSS